MTIFDETKQQHLMHSKWSKLPAPTIVDYSNPTTKAAMTQVSPELKAFIVPRLNQVMEDIEKHGKSNARFQQVPSRADAYELLQAMRTLVHQHSSNTATADADKKSLYGVVYFFDGNTYHKHDASKTTDQVVPPNATWYVRYNLGAQKMGRPRTTQRTIS